MRAAAATRFDRRAPVAAATVLVVVVLFGCAGSTAAGPRRATPGAVQEGLASYYDPKLAGHKTATGERYNPGALTAAHPTLPLGTRVRVTRPGGASVEVRINDRCSAHGRHIIDLSMAAARKLQMVRAGSVRVRLEVIAPPTKRAEG
ncbi:MAG TPA: septal ring lytic transglycosylase RlpA family protein [Polyangia bacterium]|nr:septal ring lytic transglycosylase RlpA family protein [Polyangia bacterium]